MSATGPEHLLTATVRVIDGKVHVSLPQPIDWIRLSAADAREFARLLLECATALDHP